MGNRYGIFGYSVLETFLWGPENYGQSEKGIISEDEPSQCSPKPP